MARKIAFKATHKLLKLNRIMELFISIAPWSDLQCFIVYLTVNMTIRYSMVTWSDYRNFWQFGPIDPWFYDRKVLTKRKYIYIFALTKVIFRFPRFLPVLFLSFCFVLFCFVFFEGGGQKVKSFVCSRIIRFCSKFTCMWMWPKCLFYLISNVVAFIYLSNYIGISIIGSI